MGDLRVASIAGLNGTSPVTLVKQSAAKAWAEFDGTGTVALEETFNISSLIDNGTGNYTLNHTNALAVARSPFFLACGGSGQQANTGTDGPTTTSTLVFTQNSGGSGVDSQNACASRYGDLA